MRKVYAGFWSIARPVGAQTMRSLMQDRKQFVVVCKSCRPDVPAGVKEFPFRSILVTCPLCGEQHRYLPSEMIKGRPNQLVAKKTQASAH